MAAFFFARTHEIQYSMKGAGDWALTTGRARDDNDRIFAEGAVANAVAGAVPPNDRLNINDESEFPPMQHSVD